MVDPLQRHPKYEKIQDLNAGAFGFVQLCKNKLTGEQVAIKVSTQHLLRLCRAPHSAAHLVSYTGRDNKLQLRTCSSEHNPGTADDQM